MHPVQMDLSAASTGREGGKLAFKASLERHIIVKLVPQDRRFLKEALVSTRRLHDQSHKMPKCGEMKTHIPTRLLYNTTAIRSI